jgi:hypothetical protein
VGVLRLSPRWRGQWTEATPRALIARTTSRSEPLACKEAIGWGSSDRVGLSWVGLERSSGARAIEWGSSDRVGLGRRAIGWGSSDRVGLGQPIRSQSDRVGLERPGGALAMGGARAIEWGSSSLRLPCGLRSSCGTRMPNKRTRWERRSHRSRDPVDLTMCCGCITPHG